MKIIGRNTANILQSPQMPAVAGTSQQQAGTAGPTMGPSFAPPQPQSLLGKFVRRVQDEVASLRPQQRVATYAMHKAMDAEKIPMKEQIEAIGPRALFPAIPPLLNRNPGQLAELDFANRRALEVSGRSHGFPSTMIGGAPPTTDEIGITRKDL